MLADAEVPVYYFLIFRAMPYADKNRQREYLREWEKKNI